MKTLCYISITMSTIAIIGNILILSKNTTLYSKIVRKKALYNLFKSIKAGNKPCLIGFAITTQQYEEIAPYVKDNDYLRVLQSRICTNS